MTGETDLQRLLRGMQPRLNAGEYVFCTAASQAEAAAYEPLSLFVETEAVTMILPRSRAEALGLPYETSLAWITLTVHSSLEAVGLTAAVAAALTRAGISCNVVAAYYHDHLFLPLQEGPRALAVLQALTGADHGE